MWAHWLSHLCYLLSHGSEQEVAHEGTTSQGKGSRFASPSGREDWTSQDFFTLFSDD
jgi:hypothetical protein